MNQLQKSKIAIIVPCYNEAGNIIQVIEELESIKQVYCNSDFIIVNDCSTDNTAEIVKNLNVTFLDLACNLGVGGAVQCGFKYAVENDFDYALKFDGDGQHTVISIEKLLNHMHLENSDMVIGSRFINKDNSGFQSSFMRRLGITFFKYYIGFSCGYKPTDATSGLRCYNKKALNFISKHYPAFDYPEPEEIILMIKHKFKVSEIAVVMRERTSGKSSINLLKSFYFMVKVSFAIFMINCRPKIK